MCHRMSPQAPQRSSLQCQDTSIQPTLVRCISRMPCVFGRVLHAPMRTLHRGIAVKCVVSHLFTAIIARYYAVKRYAPGGLWQLGAAVP